MFSLDLTTRHRAFYQADELTQIARGSVTYAQIGENLRRRRMQILHERYAPWADTGKQLLRHESEEGRIVVRGPDRTDGGRGELRVQQD